MNCLENLKVCKASCCRIVAFTVQAYPGSNVEKYYTTRGLSIERIDRRTIRIIIPHKCAHLDDKTCLCDLHGTDKKPFGCQNLNDDTIKAGGYYKTEGCNLGD